MKLTPNFRLGEMRCRDGTPVPKKWIPRVRHLFQQLEALREEFGGRPIYITSGYRTEAYNRKVGGVPKSQHLVCRAADIRVRGVSARKVAQTVRRLIKEGRMAQGGVGEYSRHRRKQFVHYDTRGRAARWRG